MNDKAKVKIKLEESNIDGELQQNSLGGEWYRKGGRVLPALRRDRGKGGEVSVPWCGGATAS